MDNFDKFLFTFLIGFFLGVIIFGTLIINTPISDYRVCTNHYSEKYNAIWVDDDVDACMVRTEDGNLVPLVLEIKK